MGKCGENGRGVVFQAKRQRAHMNRELHEGFCGHRAPTVQTKQGGGSNVRQTFYREFAQWGSVEGFCLGWGAI